MPQANRLTSKPHDFKGLADWVEVFRAGTHTDSAGNRLTFSAADLDQMVANHALGAAPAVLGHPKHNDPAYGWASGIKRDGESLYMRFADVHPAFEAGVKSGAYRNRSVSVIKDKDHGWRVRHVGWLGAVPPAIDGLKPVEFASDQADVHDFADTDSAVSQLVWAADNAARLFRGFREYLIEKDGIEAADRVVPAYQIDSIASSADQARAALLAAEPDADDEPTPSFSSPTNPGGAMPATQEELQRARDEAAAEAKKEAEAQFAAQGKELAELRAERQRERIATTINGFKAKGLVTPAEEAGMAAFMAELEGVTAEFNFAADGVDVKKTPSAWFAEFVASRQPLVKLHSKKAGSDTDATDDTSDDPTLISQKAMNYMAEQAAKGITVELSDAVAKFTKKA